MKKLQILLLILMSVVLLSACGSAPHPPSAGNSVKAVIKTTALTGDMNIAGIQLSITLPTGVTPPFKEDGSVDAAATVEITSTSPVNQALPGATYTPATTTAPAQLGIYSIEAAGFSASDTITIHLNIATGAKPLESDFKLLSFEATNTIDPTSQSGSVVVYGWNIIDGTYINTVSLSPTLTTTISN